MPDIRVPTPGEDRPVVAEDDDRTARARIRDAAIELFGQHGFDATSLKEIAELAGVSPALIPHHFGSKEALRAACDEHVTSSIRDAKLGVMSEGPDLDPLTALRSSGTDRAGLRYLARALGEDTPQVAALVDDLVTDAMEYMAEGERSGMVLPSDHPRERVTVLVLWTLGLMTMHGHVQRLLGVDLLDDDPDQLAPYVLPVLEILTKSVLPEQVYEAARDAFTNHGGRPTER